MGMSTGRAFHKLWTGVRGVGQSFLRLIWPPVCQNCRKPTPESTGSLCRDCWNDILKATASVYCPQCGKDASPYAILNGRCPDCISTEYHFDGIARAGVHQDALRRMIISFKAHDRTDLDPHFRLLANAAFSAAPFASHVDYFVPVPLHWTRRLARGYNQAHLIANVIEHPTARISTDIARIKRTRPQPELTPAQRARNVKGAFLVRRGHPFAGRTICLVDDVKTTGATLNECAMTLKEAGAKKVYALVISVAGQKVD
jgi:competence protein ComFC